MRAESQTYEQPRNATSLANGFIKSSPIPDLGGVYLTVYPELCELERAVTCLMLAAGTVTTFEFDDPWRYRNADHRAEALEDAEDELYDALTRLDAASHKAVLEDLLHVARHDWMDRLLEASSACDHWLKGNKERSLDAAHDDLCDVDAAIAAWRRSLSRAALGTWASQFLDYWWESDQSDREEKLGQAFRDNHFGRPPLLATETVRTLVRAGATLDAVGGSEEPFATTPLQRQTLVALQSKVLKRVALTAVLQCDSRQLFQPGGIRELLARRLVVSNCKIGGYYRPAVPVREASVPQRRLRTSRLEATGCRGVGMLPSGCG